MANKRAAKGLVLEHGGPASGGASWTTIEGHKLGNIPEGEPGLIDVTSHDSTGGEMEYINGLIDSPEMPVELIYDAENAVHEALRAANGGVAQHFRATLPGASSNHIHTFEALVRGFDIQTPLDGAQTASMSLKRSGAKVVSDS